MENKRSVYLLNQSFYPDADATGQMMTDLSEDLVKQGMGVTVIAGKRRGAATEVFNGVMVYRVPVLKLDKKILPFRYLNYLSFFPSVFIKVLLLPRPDVYFIVSSPPFMYFIGWMLKFIKKTRLIFDVQDLYPDVAVNLGLLKSLWLANKIGCLTLGMYRAADRVICIGETMQALLVKRGVPAAKLVMIHNWADGSKLYPILRAANDKFIIQYSGNIGMVHDIDTVLTAAERLRSEADVGFDFIGDGVQAKKIRDAKLPNVRLLPYKPRSELNESLNACDLALVTMKAGFGGVVVPSKLYGILATGKPVIAVCPSDSEVVSIIKENNCGIAVSPGDVNGLVKAISGLYADRELVKTMGENARKVFLAKYDRHIETNKYYDAILQLLI